MYAGAALRVEPDPGLDEIARARHGQHRSHALAAYRRSRAVELAVAGRSYQQIADELGYANRGTVHRIVHRALQRHEMDSVDALRTVEVERLDALQDGIWDRAMAGEVAAALACLKLITLRCRVLGLLEADTTAPRCTQPQTVVLQPHDCRLRGCPDHT